MLVDSKHVAGSQQQRVVYPKGHPALPGHISEVTTGSKSATDNCLVEKYTVQASLQSIILYKIIEIEKLLTAAVIMVTVLETELRSSNEHYMDHHFRAKK